jgi:acyl dehydratase
LTPFPDPTDVDADDAYEVALDAGSLTAGAEMPLTFRITQGGESAEELEPYLGALGHLVALREGDFAYLHVNPQAAQQASRSGSTSRSRI